MASTLKRRPKAPAEKAAHSAAMKTAWKRRHGKLDDELAAKVSADETSRKSSWQTC